MTEQLTRIAALLESTATKLDQTATKQAQNSEDIEVLMGAVSSNLTACSDLRASVVASEAKVNQLTERSIANETRFETLLSEMRADRQETARLWSDAVEQMNADRAQAKTQADEDRAAGKVQADNDRTAIKAQTDTDRAENARRFDAQQETIQRLLLAVVDLSRDNNRLRDRLDELGQAS